MSDKIITILLIVASLYVTGLTLSEVNSGAIKDVVTKGAR